jgi:ABC-type antimicrobial peptide transport system ATPase subunit
VNRSLTRFALFCLPIPALDVSLGAQIINLRYLSTRIAVMQNGRLVEIIEAEALCASPREDYTRKLLEATPKLPASVA